MIAARKQAKPEAAAPIKIPHIIPIANEYLIMPSAEALLNKPETNSGDIVAIVAANIPPSMDDTMDPITIMTKKPIAVFAAFSVFMFVSLFFWCALIFCVYFPTLF